MAKVEGINLRELSKIYTQGIHLTVRVGGKLFTKLLTLGKSHCVWLKLHDGSISERTSSAPPRGDFQDRSPVIWSEVAQEAKLVGSAQKFEDVIKYLSKYRKWLSIVLLFFFVGGTFDAFVHKTWEISIAREADGKATRLEKLTFSWVTHQTSQGMTTLMWEHKKRPFASWNHPMSYKPPKWR